MTESSPDEHNCKRKDFICGVVEGKFFDDQPIL